MYNYNDELNTLEDYIYFLKYREDLVIEYRGKRYFISTERNLNNKLTPCFSELVNCDLVNSTFYNTFEELFEKQKLDGRPLKDLLNEIEID